MYMFKSKLCFLQGVITVSGGVSEEEELNARLQQELQDRENEKM